MGVSEMKEIANFIIRVVVKDELSERVRKDVAEFRREYQKVHYCFENATEAYKYVRIR
jgi:glycine hydroxymethyltransferase